MPRYLGLDVHQRYVHVCEFRPELPEGQQERHFRFPNTPEAWTAFAAELDREAVVALEVTGNASWVNVEQGLTPCHALVPEEVLKCLAVRRLLEDRPLRCLA